MKRKDIEQKNIEKNFPLHTNRGMSSVGTKRIIQNLMNKRRKATQEHVWGEMKMDLEKFT